jgi:predicted ATPase
VLGATSFWQGEFVRSRAHLEAAIALYDPRQSHIHLALYTQDPKVVCLCRLALDLWCLGYPDQALQTGQDSLVLARNLSHPFSLAYAMYFDTLFHCLFRTSRATQECAEATIALCREHQVGYWLELTVVLLAWAQAAQGEVEAGIAQMHESMTNMSAAGIDNMRPYYMALLAEQYAGGGDVAHGLALVAQALDAVDRNGDCWCAAELLRIKGELLLRRGEQTEAEDTFRRAIAVARSQEARSLELRAATSLARLWQVQNRPAEARQMLAEIYSWFSEGFDTPDLKDAQALLAHL